MKKSFFLDYFPPPEYLAMPALGLDISDRSIKYAQLRRKNGVFRVVKFGTRLIPEGIIESGEIKRKDELSGFLSSLREELGEKNIIVSLPEEKGFLGRAKLPLMKEDEIRGALEAQLEENIPLSPENAIFDFDLTKRAEKENSIGYLEVNISAFPKKMVEDYRDALSGAGFEPLVFEMEAWAFARAVIPRGVNAPYFIVDFGKTRTTFAIVSSGKVQFTSTINVAGNNLNAALIKSLGIDETMAEKTKKEKGLMRNKKDNNEEVFVALLPLVSAIKDEIKKHIAYWNSRREKIEKIILCGGDSNLPGFTEYLAYELKIPVELCNPWANIVSFEEYIPGIALKDSLMYATALGLALRSAAYDF